MTALALPTLAPTIPFVLDTAATSRAYSALGYQMANLGLFKPEDLRVGTGGVRRLVEKALQRWWVDTKLPLRIGHMPADYFVTDRAHLWVPEAQEGEPWLMLANCAAAQKAYLRHQFEPHHQRTPGSAALALATLYTALDTVAYSLTPPMFLELARHYWWNGADDVTPGTKGVMSRKLFDNRFPRFVQAPRPLDHRGGRLCAPTAKLWTLGEQVRRLNRATPLLRRNAFELTNLPVAHPAIILRWKWGDQMNRLMDDWHQDILWQAGAKAATFHGAWPMRNAGEIQAVLAALPNTVRLIAATERLLLTLAQCTGRSPYGGW